MSILDTPDRRVDVVIDTDTYNEADDQFALAYLFGSQERCRIEALYAAPFTNERAETAKIGMEKSYGEILKLLRLMGNDSLIPRVFCGSDEFLPDEKTPVSSPAALDLIARARRHTAEDPLYVIGIAALTDVASALLLDPSIAEKIVVVWLGGKAFHMADAREFNLKKDIAAARVVFAACKGRLVHVPCMGVASQLLATGFELEKFLHGKSPLCDYLVENLLEIEKKPENLPWSRPLWDVAAVAWLNNDGQRFMRVYDSDIPLVSYEMTYSFPGGLGRERYVYYIERDALIRDLFERISKPENLLYREEKR